MKGSKTVDAETASAIMSALNTTIGLMEPHSAEVFLSLYENAARIHYQRLPKSERSKIETWILALRRSVGHDD